MFTQRTQVKVSERPLRVGDDARGRCQIHLRDARGLVPIVVGDGHERQALRPTIDAGCDRDHERGLVWPSGTAFSTLGLTLLPAQDRVVHLDAAVELAALFIGLRGCVELLAREPSAIVLDPSCRDSSGLEIEFFYCVMETSLATTSLTAAGSSRESCRP